jgi:hypothetical protein
MVPEAEAGGPLGPGIQDQPGQRSENLSQKNYFLEKILGDIIPWEKQFAVLCAWYNPFGYVYFTCIG